MAGRDLKLIISFKNNESIKILNDKIVHLTDTEAHFEVDEVYYKAGDRCIYFQYNKPRVENVIVLLDVINWYKVMAT